MRKKIGFLTDLKTNYNLYLMILPGFIGFIVFCYLPIYGLIIAFKQYDLVLGFFESPWVGFKHFQDFFTGIYFTRLLSNTLLLGLLTLLFTFWPPILFAILLNELSSIKLKKLFQTISYLPYFIAVVVIVGMMMDIFSPTGIVNRILESIGAGKVNFFGESRYFRPLYIGSAIWQMLGYSSILYLSAMTGIDVQLYEASYMDGANRFQRIWHITLPGLLPVITILLVLNSGQIINVGFEKVFLMQNPAIYNVADIIQTYVYRRGIMDRNFSFATAVGFFNSVVAFAIIYVSNMLSRRLNQNSLW